MMEHVAAGLDGAEARVDEITIEAIVVAVLAIE